jgi:hypothetical protein
MDLFRNEANLQGNASEAAIDPEEEGDRLYFDDPDWVDSVVGCNPVDWVVRTLSFEAASPVPADTQNSGFPVTWEIEELDVWPEDTGNGFIAVTECVIRYLRGEDLLGKMTSRFEITFSGGSPMDHIHFDFALRNSVASEVLEAATSELAEDCGRAFWLISNGPIPDPGSETKEGPIE